MDDMPPLPPGKNLFERMIASLGKKNPRLNEYVAEILRRVGKPVMPLLVREAVCKGKQPDHRVRILDIIQRVGEPLDMAFFDLMMLMRHRSPRVREKASEVIAALSPAGRADPNAAETLAPAVLALMGGELPKREAKRRVSPGNGPEGSSLPLSGDLCNNGE